MLITEIKRMNRAAGGHFFDPATMRGFGSRVLPHTWTGTTRTFFITSEQQDDEHPRLYTVRVFDSADGSVRTHGQWQAYDTTEQAYDAARNAALEDLKR
jgi:hypothetical protein